MKILLLVPDFSDPFVSHMMSRLSSNDDNLDIKTFSYEFDVSMYDIIYIFPGMIHGHITDSIIKKKVGPLVLGLLSHHNSVLLLHHHYSCFYHAVTLTFRVVTENLFINPFGMLVLLHKYPVIENYQFGNGDHDTFIFANNSAIICLVSRVNVEEHDKKLMPVIPLNEYVSTNFEFDIFFNESYISLPVLREFGDSFWKMNFYQIWESFYHKTYG